MDEEQKKETLKSIQENIQASKLESLRRRFQDSDELGIVAPAHIVSGDCTYEAFERYLLTHPIQKIRAIDAIKLFAIVLPLSQAQGIAPDWNIQDIIGKQERKDEDGKE